MPCNGWLCCEAWQTGWSVCACQARTSFELLNFHVTIAQTAAKCENCTACSNSFLALPHLVSKIICQHTEEMLWVIR